MGKVSREEIINNSEVVKVKLTDEEVDYCMNEVNKFFDNRPELNCDEVNENCVVLEPLRYVNSDVVNVFSARGETLISAEDMLSNTLDKEGNYIKVPKVLK